MMSENEVVRLREDGKKNERIERFSLFCFIERFPFTIGGGQNVTKRNSLISIA
jgi:hypothetical protein